VNSRLLLATLIFVHLMVAIATIISRRFKRVTILLSQKRMQSDNSGSPVEMILVFAGCR